MNLDVIRLKRYKKAGTKTMEWLFSAIAFISGLLVAPSVFPVERERGSETGGCLKSRQ
jgi:hypothetical protein